MKIISLNVNGIRASVKKGLIDFLKKEDADIVCLSEVKLSLTTNGGLTTIKGDKTKIPKELKKYTDENKYELIWNDSTSKKGYAGTAVLTKLPYKSKAEGIQDAEDMTDKEGRCITLDFNKFYLINTYVPNSGVEKLKFKERRLRWDKFFDLYIKKLQSQKPVIWCGDMNVARFQTDVYDGTTNKLRNQTAGFTDYERFNFKVLLEDNNLVDTWYHLNPNKHTSNAYSFWSYRGNKMKENNRGWRLDYFILSNKLKSKIKDMKVLQEYKLSDHCPIILNINDI